MKIIHTGDVHLGSAMNSAGDPKVTAKLKRDLVDSFKDLAKYAEKEGIRVVMLSGDVFDKDFPAAEERQVFYDVVRSLPGTDFLYLKGNHDALSSAEGAPQNIRFFSENEWTAYRYGNVVISGREAGKSQVYGQSAYDELSLDPAFVNIVMMHGNTYNGNVNLSALKGKNIDYLALGDIHKIDGGEIDYRGKWQYCGCLMGRGFDETGEHGFFVYDTDKKAQSFEPLTRNVIEETEADVTGATSFFDAAGKVKAAVTMDSSRMYRITLTGTVEKTVDIDSLEEDVSHELKGACLFASVVSRARYGIDYTAYEGDRGLRGRFVKLVRKSGYTDEEKDRILAYFFAALGGDK
ncbi:MAG: metallophosphoesterase [Clostridia bacterium]|nr:metallophosphoesterase [Clostridia bacterium]